jgi:hypothetical protein|tara:strand:- start:475 stop:999 length:525 start_codon:yes stop_codon:yes gene_type:complete
MKRFAVLIGLLSVCGPAYSEVHHRIQSSIQLTVDGASSVATRVPSTISVSGSNIAVGSGNNDTFSGLTVGSATAAPTGIMGNYNIHTAGQSFSFSNSYLQGDPIATLNAGSTVSTTTGQVQSIPSYGQTTTFAGGTKSTLAGTLTSVGGGTTAIVGGGAGTTAIAQHVQELTIR